MNRVKRSIMISRPVSEVFALLTDAQNDERWMFGMTGTDLVTPGAMHEGSKVVCKFGLGPMTTMRASAVIEEFEPGRRFVRTRVGGIMAMKGEFTVQPEQGGTRFDWTMETALKVPLLGPLLDPLIGMWMGMSISLSMNKFKTLVESGQLTAPTERENASYAS